MGKLPNDTLFGIIQCAWKRRDDKDSHYVIGNSCNGFFISSTTAEKILTPEAVKQGVPYNDYLCYPEETTGLIVTYELPHYNPFKRLTKKQRLENLHKLKKICPEYVKSKKEKS